MLSSKAVAKSFGKLYQVYVNIKVEWLFVCVCHNVEYHSLRKILFPIRGIHNMLPPCRVVGLLCAVDKYMFVFSDVYVGRKIRTCGCGEKLREYSVLKKAIKRTS